MKQYLKDKLGELIEVTDLQAAIKQVAAFVTYKHQNPSPRQAAQDLERHHYYKDLFIKLAQLKGKKPKDYGTN